MRFDAYGARSAATRSAASARTSASTRTATASQTMTASHACFYKLHDATAAGVATDSLGNGPSITYTGTKTNILSNSGWFTFSGDGFFPLRGNTYINNLMSLNGFTGGIIWAFDVYPVTASPAATNSLLSCGSNDVAPNVGLLQTTHHATSGRPRIRLTGQSSVSAATKELTDTSPGGLTNSSGSLNINTRHSYLIHWDLEHKKMNLWADGYRLLQIAAASVEVPALSTWDDTKTPQDSGMYFGSCKNEETNSTTVLSNYASGTSIDITSTTGVTSGDWIQVTLDSGAVEWRTVNGAPVGNTVTLSSALSGPAAAGNTVTCFAMTNTVEANLRERNIMLFRFATSPTLAQCDALAKLLVTDSSAIPNLVNVP